MSFKLQIISILYRQYLEKYYERYSFIKEETYQKQYDHLLNDSSELVALYTRTFNKLGLDTSYVITNAHALQTAWKKQNNIDCKNNISLVYEQIKNCNPDVLWIEDASYLNKDWINYVRRSMPSIKLIMSSHCAPCNDKLLNEFGNLDFVITCTPGIKLLFENNGIKSYLVYHGFDPGILEKLDQNNDFPDNDFVFSGSLYMGGGFHFKRIEYIERILKSDINLKIYGNLESKYKIWAKQLAFCGYRGLRALHLEKIISSIPFLRENKGYGDTPIKNYSKRLINIAEPAVFGLDMYKAIYKAKITLNMHGEVSGEYAGNVRLFEATGVGTCLLTERKKNLPDSFDCNSEIVVYDSIEDCIDKVKWLFQNDEKRKEIAKKGQQKTLKSHTIEERCKQIIEIIHNELKISR